METLRTLVVRPISGKLLHDTEMFGKMDPYVKVIIGNLLEKTTVAKKQHLTPTWDSELVFNLSGVETDIIFEVWNKELITKDDLVGTGCVSFNSFNNGLFNQWIPLLYKGKDAGAILVEMNLSGTETVGTTLLETPVTTGMTSELEPIVHRETVHTTGETVVTRENPIVYEKKIITEKPIITERTIINVEQPINVEKHEFVENTQYQKEAPRVIQDETVLRQMEPMMTNQAPQLYGTPIVQQEVEFRRENPEIIKETPELFQKNIITETPVVHEKDIIHREIPIIHEKPEVHEKPILHKGDLITETDETLYRTEVGGQLPDLSGQDTNIHTESVNLQGATVYQKERPEIFEKEVIQSRPIIHEQPIVYTEQQVLQERPEVVEKRIFHQEQPLQFKEKHGTSNLEEPRP